LELLAVFIIVLVQGHLAVTVLPATRRHLSPRRARLVGWLLMVFYVSMTAACVVNLSFLDGRLPIASSVMEIAGAVAETWFLGSTAGYLLYLAFRQLYRSVGHPFSPVRREWLHAAGGALLAAPFVAVGYGALIERLQFHVREVDVPIPNLADDLNGLRLLHLSDIHLSAFLDERDLARVIDTANSLHPHLALVTGDLISSAGDPLEACLGQLARLRTDAGILGCMGNHEHYAGVQNRAAQAGDRLGIPFLRSRAESLRFGAAVLNIAGVDYQPSHRTYLPGAERLVVPGACNLLLSHNPDVFPVAVAKGYALMLAGHTHGGQVAVEILSQSVNPARFFTPYVYGLYRQGAAAAYVTRGIGTIGIPARIGAPPEIALLRLRKA
jgi:predicted MPP superfamily phosphohydrolase